MKERTTLGDGQPTQYYFRKKHDEASAEGKGAAEQSLLTKTSWVENYSSRGTKSYVEKTDGPQDYELNNEKI